MTTKEIDFSRFSSMRIGPILPVSIIESIEDGACFSGCIIGGAHNLIVTGGGGIELGILGSSFDYIRYEDNKLFVGAATKSGTLFSFAKKNNLSGFEFLGGLPGTLGGIVAMNAGLKEFSIFDMIIGIRFIDGYREKADIAHGYRFAELLGTAYEIVCEAKQGFNPHIIDSLRLARANQPKLPSAGSCFKNPPNEYAGRLLEICGLKGYRLGDMAFSDQHANFLVNMGCGSVKDALSLIEMAQKTVFEKTGIMLQTEVKII